MIMFSVFGQTMATYCGQNMGAGKIDRVKRGILAGDCLHCDLVRTYDHCKLYDRRMAGISGNRKS